MIDLRCPVCKTQYKSENQIILDDFNGTTHKNCYQQEVNSIKDVGTYNEIVNKYDFFREFRK